MKAFLKALILAVIDIFRDWKMDRDYEEALIENARRDAEARDRAGQDATRERIRDVPAFDPDPDPDALRQWLRDRDPGTK